MELEAAKPNIVSPNLNRSNSTEVELNSYIKSNGKNWDDPELQITYSFQFEEELSRKLSFLQLNSDPENTQKGKNAELTVKEINKTYHKLLRNPIVELYLQIKWRLMRNIFVINFTCYGLFLVMLTTMSILIVELDKCNNETNFEEFENLKCGSNGKLEIGKVTNFASLLGELNTRDSELQFVARCFSSFAIFTVAGLVLLTGRELLVLCHEGWRTYLKSLENWLDMITIGATAATILSVILDKDSIIIWASWACCIAWLKLSYGMVNIPSFGGYLFLLCQMAKKVFLYILMFLPIIIGFALKFHLTLSTQESFSDFHAIPKVFAMMIGEMEYEDIFLSQILQEISTSSKKSFAIFREVEGNISFVIFTVVCHIVLVNALIGLSVNVTEDFRTQVESIRLARIAHHLGSVQSHLKCSCFNSYFAKKALKDLDKAELRPNSSELRLYIPSLVKTRSFWTRFFYRDLSRMEISWDILERTMDILKERQEKEDVEAQAKARDVHKEDICQKLDGMRSSLYAMDKKISTLMETLESQMAQIQKLE